MAGPAIFYLLNNDATLTDLVGDQIYPSRSPQGVTGNYIVYKCIDGNPSNTKNGPSTLDSDRWQIDYYGKDDEVVDQMAKAGREALDYKSGIINGVNIKQIRFINPNTGFDNKGEKFRKSDDFNIRINR